MSVLVSCEVGGENVPTQLIPHLVHTETNQPDERPDRLPHDAAAMYVAHRMSQRLYAPLIANEYSLALIDVTRSLHHRQLFPPLTRQWSAKNRDHLIELIHHPYRQRIRAGIGQLFRHFPYVIHLSVRSFPLREGGKLRRADVGLLYDPAVDDEVDLCLDWIDEMYEEIPMLRVRRNYPRRGTTDSITKAMRSEWAGKNYIGIEVLLNRAWVSRPLAIRDEVIDGMCDTLRTITAASHSDAA